LVANSDKVPLENSRWWTYFVIFTCLAVQAVYLEVCHSLDTDSFVLARQCKYSFEGHWFFSYYCRLLLSINKVHDALLQKGIKWFFNPLGACHHGGVWERLIRSTRKVLGALVKEQSLDDESLQTFLCESGSVINGRPLTTVSNDSTDLEPLSPNHLLLVRCDTPLLPGLFVKNDMC